ncbi:MAG: methyltransferase domain-containing protein [Desulfuromonadales bacterium]
MLRSVKNIIRKLLFFLPDHLIGVIYFELYAYLGNLISRSLVLDTGAQNFINIGSGPNVATGCINIDFFSTHGIDYGTDLRRPLKIADSSVDGVFSEHTIEHLTYADADRLLRECFRIMKPGGVIRIIVPDISLFIKHFSDHDELWFKQWEQLIFINSDDKKRSKRRLASPLQAISFVTQEYGHVSSWDFPTVTYYLEKNGFSCVTKVSFMQGQCSQILFDQNNEERKFVSLYVEAQK